MSTEIKERPILFSAPMVRAIIEGRKTQTRRLFNETPEDFDDDGHPLVRGKDDKLHRTRCRYGKIGDRLWVRESFAYDGEVGGKEFFLYTATDSRCQIDSYEPVKWTPSIHMPRRASRISLEITGVRVERLQDISEDDAKAEGWHGDISKFPDQYPALWFQNLWASINGEESWNSNPWVWVVEFKRLNP